MKLIICRVKYAKMYIDNVLTEEIGNGLFCLLGITSEDSDKDVDFLIKKCANMRIFSDENDKMNLSVKDIGGEILIEPNFTLCANIRHGNRPDFFGAMQPNNAKLLFNSFISKLKADYPKIKAGVFGADMKTEVYMDGPVTIVADTKELLI